MERLTHHRAKNKHNKNTMLQMELSLEERSDYITQLRKLNDRLVAYYMLKTYVKSEWELRQIDENMKPLHERKDKLKSILEQR